jgi:hypothetical protein
MGVMDRALERLEDKLWQQGHELAHEVEEIRQAGPITFLVPRWTLTDWIWGAGVWVRALRDLCLPVQVIVTGEIDADAQQRVQQAGAVWIAQRVRGLCDWSGLRRLRKYLQQQPVSVLLCWGAAMTALGVVWRQYGSQRHVSRATVVAMEAASVGHGVRRWLLSRAVRQADRVVIPAPAAVDEYVRLGMRVDQCDEWPVPGDLCWVEPEQSLPVVEGPSSRPTLWYLSPDEDDYGGRQAIIIHDILRYHRRQLHLVVVAASLAQQQRLQDLAQRLAFDDLRVRFVPLAQLHPKRLSDQVVLATSRRIHLPQIIAAMYQGAVVASWRTPQTVALVENGVRGWLVTPGQTAELAERVRLLLDEPEQLAACATAARQWAQQQWPRRYFQQRFVRWYCALLRLKVGSDYPLMSSVPTMSSSHDISG